MSFQHIKVLPILIIVAMLAFSVRFVEFAVGVSSLSGSAFAAAEKEEGSHDGEEKPPEPAEKVVVTDGLEEGDVKIVDDTKPPAPAEEKPEEDKKVEMSDPPKIDQPSIDWRDASDEEFEYSAVRQEMYENLTDRRKELDAQEKNIQAREALLKAAEQELDRKYQEMIQLRDEIESLLDEQSEEEQTRIASLVKVYEGMKPKDAARIFDTLDLDVLVSVMSRMSERKMSPVLANMNPERARTVTIMLAEEKQLPTLPNVN